MFDDQDISSVRKGESFLEKREFREPCVKGRPASDPSPHTRQTRECLRVFHTLREPLET